ncbi:MAG: hypothetical protein WCS01_10680 [bacterium]
MPEVRSASGSRRTWVKKGLIFAASGQSGWMNSHAQVPTVWQKDQDTLRIFFSTRPQPGLSLTTFLDVSASDPSRILYEHDCPILELGKPGTFDEHGIMPSCIVEHGGRIYLYYSGWSRCVGVPYNNLTGLAVSDDGENFTRVCEGPVLTRTPLEPFSATSPFVLKHDGRWLAWYCSGIGWQEIDGKMEHQYDIKFADSDDGLWWRQAANVVLRCREEQEALTRPTVIEHEGRFHMWFCHRGMKDFRDGATSYHIGYASSIDLASWTRADELAGIGLSAKGWDSLALAYPYVIKVAGKLMMFYNGNGFGQSGFGYAEWMG